MINKKEFTAFVDKHINVGHVVHMYKDQTRRNAIACCHECHDYVRMIWPETADEDDLIDEVIAGAKFLL